MCKSDAKLFLEQINVLFANEYEVDIVVLDEVSSTNDWVIQQFRQGRKLPIVCFAEKQTAGRGRRGKQWVGGIGSNIAMTLAWPFKLAYAELTWLPLVMAMAIVKTLTRLGVKNSQVKWPNDVLVNNKKIAGILLETVGASQASGYNHGPALTVIGIGLNYDMSVLLEGAELNGIAVTDIISVMKTSTLDTVDNKVMSEGQYFQLDSLSQRGRVAAILLENCLTFCQGYPENVVAVQQEFTKNYDYCKDKLLDIMLDDGSKLVGIAQGLTPQAELIVLVDNQRRIFHSADISVSAST